MGLRAIISCKGFHEGEHYYATGYAEDAPRTVTQRWLGSAARSDEKGFVGLMIFRGSATSGMSGGPVNDDDGATVGLVEANSEDGVTIALGLPFTDTPLCKRG
jgi:S1-C subfamily serine protease